jgi:hypothetical protein
VSPQVYAAAVPSAREGFLADECDELLASQFRAEVDAAGGAGWDRFELDLFDVEIFDAENRVRIAEVVPLGYADSELTITEFLAAMPDVPPGQRMRGRPRRPITLPPPSSA